LDKINNELESDIMIRAIHDVKGIDMGNSLCRYKAELDFDGRELSRVYLDKQDLSALLEVSLEEWNLSSLTFSSSSQEVKGFQTIDELEAYMLKHGESIVDLMGGEIDRIEMKLRVSLFSPLLLMLLLTLNYFFLTEKVPWNQTLWSWNFVKVLVKRKKENSIQLLAVSC